MKRLAQMSIHSVVSGVVVAALILATPIAAQSARGAKVFISVDMEGLAGVVSSADVSSSANGDYQYFRTIMAGETNAAIAGAFKAGASEVLVRDSHGGKQNLLPDALDPRAKLMRGVSTGGKNMMEGIDSTFDAVVFIGYHARAGTPDAVLAHTSTGNVVDFSINGVSLPEGGYNALVAGLYGVPVVFVAGDKAVVEQLRSLLGPIDALAVKEVRNGASLGLSPEEARNGIARGVETAVRNRARARPYKLVAPYEMSLEVKKESGQYAAASRVKQGLFRYSSPDLLEILNAFNALK